MTWWSLHDFQFPMDLLVKTVCQNSFAKVINAIKVAHLHWFSVQNCTENWLYMFLTLRMMFFVIIIIFI